MTGPSQPSAGEVQGGQNSPGGGRRSTFRALQVRNYRLYLVGNTVSLLGTHVQNVAQGWLVVHVLGGTGVELGLVYALAYLPLLLLAPYGGLFADRHVRRRIIMTTQAVLAASAALLAAVTVTGVVRLWMVFAASAVNGMVGLFDTPARHSFGAEIVGREHVANAVSLNSAVFNLSRVVGPALASGLIPLVGVGPCFAVNSASFGAVIFGLWRMRASELHTVAPVERSRGQIREAVRYVWREPQLRTALAVLAVVGTFTMNYTVLLPLFARDALHGSSSALGALNAALGVGSMGGALYGARRARPTVPLLLVAGLGLGVMFGALAISPSLVVAFPVLVVAGVGHIIYLNTTNALLQFTASEPMRGRVMSFYSQLFLGSTPVGGPTMGLVSDHFGVRIAVAVAGGAAVAATLAGGGSLTRRCRQQRQ